MQRVLIIGATSAIAEAVARRYASRAASLHIIGRSTERMVTIANDLLVRGAAQVTSGILDIADTTAHAKAISDAIASLGKLDIVLIAHGTLPDQTACNNDVDLAMREFHINGTATISLAHRIANQLNPGSTLAVISSVAGDRGRASNYLYGSAKAAVSTYLSGMRQQLSASDIRVVTIKPGFVDTPMTAGFEKKGPLWASADTVAKGIVRAIDNGRPVAYLPWFWWGIMQIIRNIPERLFRRIKL